MKKYILALTLTLGVVIQVCAQEAVISSYYLDNDYRDCWTEILVVEDDVDMRGYRLRDMNSSLTSFNDFITFDNVPFWNHLRAGTVIILYSASANSLGTTHSVDTNKTDGSVQVNAQMTNLFTIPGGTNPWTFRSSGQLLDLHGPGSGDNNHIHALGHNDGGNFFYSAMPFALNHDNDGRQGQTLIVWPGNTLSRYNSGSSGTTYTKLVTNFTNASFGLPNDSLSTLDSNTKYWRSLRQPTWSSPSFSIKVGPAGSYDTLSWSKATDPYPSDSTQGYMVLRNSSNSFTDPVDGHTYQVNDVIGSATVIGIVRSSQISTFVDKTFPDCNNTYYYRIYAFRYLQDVSLGNDYHKARGRAYNETNYSSGSLAPKKPSPTAIKHY